MNSEDEVRSEVLQHLAAMLSKYPASARYLHSVIAGALKMSVEAALEMSVKDGSYMPIHERWRQRVFHCTGIWL